MKYEINTSQRSLEVDFNFESDGLIINVDGKTLHFQAIQIHSGVYSVLVNNRSFVVGICPNEANRVNVNGTPINLELLDAVHLHLRELGWDSMQETKVGLISAQIPGLVTKIFHVPGDEVKEGEPLLLIEAMKMENEIKSPVSGVVQKISVNEGQTVEKGTNIIEIV
ncbi:MAG: acetyl-CoA carboxylase biotin carboxyl carrier protein subunit [Candidatus Marinimicrobia bacterium]|jgi:biotin carboxyl carrier protein|nr:acetyl-CoA carboxylase biotin carboxyl carrier protein subunit [Candidatus Neomarinimicrobiota bacterium]MBT3631352.1 acetyl-CoA carboxylase biotin carboxyl carrier protein subunit [Candidatus Neomarinimicrobiota bacterium]MBT3823763.1 acetyl-CoA carboxylase biotin carboxyl carrier protein subunit [Candidatus Neomarinimicrobiota bacterium]MBT4130745.1 acetyl-CoA carboxylase biotin carboxyl carrier protein subunit [Candidatus Neomarinimicrobiota bacterium]MBT4294798.1 acetyl-CoA carboxylase b